MAEELESTEPNELPPEVIPVEPPLVQPARPGPNIAMAFLWWLTLLAAQIGLSVLAVVGIIVTLLIVHGRKGLTPNLFDSPGALLTLIITATGGTVLVAVGAVAVRYRGRASRIVALRGLDPCHAVLILLLLPPLLIFGSEVQVLASRVLPQLHLNDAAYKTIAQENWAIILLVACVFPGIGEELFFRAFLGRGLVAQHGVVWGTLFTSALFGALHFDPPQVVGTAVLGIVLQIVYLNTKSFLGPAMFHALNNAAAFGLMRLSADPRWQAILGEDEDVPPLLAAAALAAMVTFCWLLYACRTRWILPDGRAWSPGYVTAEMPPAHLGAVAKLAMPSVGVVAAAALAYIAFAAALGWELRAVWQ